MEVPRRRRTYARPVAYDEVLAERIRDLLAAEADLTEQPMFGGLAFLVRGHMALAASGRGGLMVRVDPADGDELVAAGDAEPMEMRGRAMSGWVRVPAAAVRTEDSLARWVERGVARVASLPPKAPSRPRAAARMPKHPR